VAHTNTKTLALIAYFDSIHNDVCRECWLNVMPWLQLRFDYDMTTIRLRSDYNASRAPASIRREQNMNISVFRRSRIVVKSHCDIGLRIKPTSLLRFDYDTTIPQPQRIRLRRVIEITMCIRFDCNTANYDKTTTKNWHVHFLFASNESTRAMCRSRIV